MKLENVAFVAAEDIEKILSHCDCRIPTFRTRFSSAAKVASYRIPLGERPPPGVKKYVFNEYEDRLRAAVAALRNA